MCVAKSTGSKRLARARYVLKEGFLDEQSKKWAGVIPFDSPVESMDSIIERVQLGELQALHVYENGVRVGVTIYQINREDYGRELLSVASWGSSQAGGDLFDEIMPLLEILGAQQGCKTIRMHTMRHGLARKALHRDFFVSEIVLRKEIKPIQLDVIK